MARLPTAACWAANRCNGRPVGLAQVTVVSLVAITAADSELRNRDRSVRFGPRAMPQVHTVRSTTQTARSKQSVLVVAGHPRFVHMRRCLRIVCTDARRGFHVRRHVRVIARLVGVRRHRAQGWGLRIVRADTGIRLRAGRAARVIARLVDMRGDRAQRRCRGGVCARGRHLCKGRRRSQGAQRSDRRCDRESLQKGFHKHGFQLVVSIHAASSEVQISQLGIDVH